MFRQVRFECGACGDGFVDWHDDDWERSAVFCVHCGAPIVALGSVIPPALDAHEPHSSDSGPARSLGVLKSEGDGFRDTLPGLTIPPPDVSRSNGSELPEASDVSEVRKRDTEPTVPRATRPRGTSEATSTMPNARLSIASWGLQRRRWAPVVALLVGFASGVPAALWAENPLLRLMNPAAQRNRQLNEQLTQVSAAIDHGEWDRARAFLDRAQALSPAGDSRVVSQRARLTLGLILANRPADAERELSSVPESASLHPSVADLRRVYDALFAAKRSAPASNAGQAAPAASASASKPKVVVTKRELLSFARDRQRRAQLDDAQRLYGEVLRTHPNDAEARCGLAEVQLLRGSTDDGTRSFERALADNANYSPAWVGLADIDWLSGHPERAACRYRAVIERFPAGSYPPYIVQRVAQVTNSGANAPVPRSGVSALESCD
jgi:tetratricopeptide (TPR) repeat protein